MFKKYEKAYGIYLLVITSLFVIGEETAVAQGVCVTSTDAACDEIGGGGDLDLNGAVPDLRFTDTSSLPGGNDWRIDINEGDTPYWAIEDAQTGNLVFRIDGDAPENSIRADSDGDVGFGTATPTGNLHILDVVPDITFEDPGFGSDQVWKLYGDEVGFTIRDVTDTGTDSNVAGSFQIRSGAPLRSLHIVSNGDIGIGTELSGPEASLHLRRANGTAKIVVEEATSVGGARVMLELSNKGEPQFRMTHTAAGASWFFTTSGLGNFKLSKAGTGAEELALDGNGNLMLRGNLTACATALAGADTCNPDNSTFPDYVFEPGYPLMPLAEVEEFVAREKHLPNVISADETAENGINMTQLQLQLLEKVEELTLYTIEQEKELEKAHGYIERLREQLEEELRRNDRLESRLSRLETRLDRETGDD